MGKVTQKRQPPEAGKPESGQTTGWQAGRLTSRKAFHLLIIVILGFLAYSNTFQSPLQWDESEFIIENPIVRDLGFFTEPSRAEGLPVYDGLKSRYVGYLTFALNYKLHGPEVFGYHVVNIAIHLINAVLVYFFVLLTLRTPFFSGQHSAVSTQRAEDTPLNPPLPRGEVKVGAIHDFRSSPIPSPQSPVPGFLSPITNHHSQFFSLAVALLFAVHPIQTEAVTYVFQRLASLVSMFYLMSLVLYIKTRQGAMGEGLWEKNLVTDISTSVSSVTIPYRLLPIAYYSLSLLCAVLAMKTKENAFTLPLVIMLYEFLFFSGQLKTRILRLVPFLLTMLIVPLTIMGASGSAGEIISQVKDPVSDGHITPAPQDYLFTQSRVIVTYLRLLFLPVGQNIDYDYPLYKSFFTPPVFMSFLLLAAVFGFAVYLIYRSSQADKLTSQPADNDSRFTIHDSQFANYSRLIAFGILWFFITLSVESSIIPIPMLINEYRAYLPSVGFFIALVAGGALLLKQASRFTLHASSFTAFAAVIFALIILGLASATYARNALWKDKISLWEDVVRKSPNSPRGYSNLGIAYYEKDRYDKAIEMYERCLSLQPSHRQANMNLGIVYAVTGRPDIAIQYFTRSIAVDPTSSNAYLNLGRAYSQVGHPDKAVENYIISVDLDPYNSGAYHGMGTAYVKLGSLDEAIAAYTRFAELSPNNPEAYRNRGNVYTYKGDFVSAGADFRKACSLGSNESCNYLQNPQFR